MTFAGPYTAQEIIPTSYGLTTADLPVGSLRGLFVESIVFQTVTILTTLLRIWSRKKLHVGFKGDDWSALAAAVATVVLCILSYFSAAGGVRVEGAIYIFNIVIPAPTVAFAAGNTVSAVTALFLTKISILLLYRRIFPQKWLMISVFVLIALSVAWWVTFTIVSVLLSYDLSAAYHQGTDQYNTSLVALKRTTEGMITLDIITDVAILLLPAPIIARLHTRWSRKIKVYVALVLGLSHLIIGSVRFALLFNLINNDNGGDTSNFLYSLRGSFALTILLTSTGVNYLNIPAIKMLVDALLDEHPHAKARMARVLPACLRRKKQKSGSDAAIREGELEELPRTERDGNWLGESAGSRKAAAFQQSKPLPELPDGGSESA